MIAFGGRLRGHIAWCLEPARLRRTIVIALVMGTAYTAMNQLHVLLGRGPDLDTVVRCAGNYILPFVVANLGLLASRTAST